MVALLIRINMDISIVLCLSIFLLISSVLFINTMK